MKGMTRRDFLFEGLKVGAGLSLSPLFSCSSRPARRESFHKKIVILGIDGMDPLLLHQFVMEGVMPNFLQLIYTGSFRKMTSSIPPQSPVAWSDFAIGASAGIHGIFDFIHRDPETMTPYLSSSTISEASNTFQIGDWRIPLGSGEAKQLREGKPFWEYLGEAGIPCTIFKLPGNFPVASKTAKCVSGMGTPDLLGSYGTFAYFTSDPPDDLQDVTGGVVIPVHIIDNKISAEMIGPVNTLRMDKSRVKVPFVVWRDPQNHVVKIKIQDHVLVMTTGEWSDWIQLSFDLVPHVRSVKGICKILIKQIHPHFEMYVSPVNVHPTNQAVPVTCPVAYGRELVDHIGLFGTKGLPADTKGLSYGILSEEEYLELSRQILDESRKAMQYELGKLQTQTNGVLFFYFSNLDQDTHMYWRTIDSAHPLYTPRIAGKYSNAIRNLYIEMDNILGDVYKQFDINDDNFRLIIMSDHGFAPFYRSVTLNTWLLNNGYISLIDRHSQDQHTFFENVNWSRTQAYGLGINALYLNVEGRERYGTVPRRYTPERLTRLKKQLLVLKDPLTGENAISRIWSGSEIYNREDNKTPDLIIGWNKGYRASWETVLGGFPLEVFVNNEDKWSGDHCIDPFWVPAVLLANRKITLKKPTLPDVTATILAECNTPIPEQMSGKLLYDI
jgi:predicted AlkP superfamily phosphohydrolase/phosphomutase